MESTERLGQSGTSDVLDDTEVEIPQSYQSESYGKGSQSKGNPVETALGEQVPEGWFITWYFTTRIGVFTMGLLAFNEERLVDRHWDRGKLNCAVDWDRGAEGRAIYSPEVQLNQKG